MQVTQSKVNSFHFDFSSGKSIYLQLAEKLELMIVSGAYKPGEKLPPVRDLALKAKINPNTVQKSLGILEDKNLIATDRTNGKYVTTDFELLKTAKLALAKKYTTVFLHRMNAIGLSKTETLSILKETGTNLKGTSNEELSF